MRPNHDLQLLFLREVLEHLNATIKSIIDIGSLYNIYHRTNYYESASLIEDSTFKKRVESSQK